MIKVFNINKKYGKNQVLKNISFDVNKGEIISIIGPSGAGKSTLIRCLDLLIQPDEGNILINNKNIINSKSIYKDRQKIGMVFQNYNLFEHLTVKENITISPIKLLKMNKEEAEEIAIKLLDFVGLMDKINSMPSELSGGQKQRVAIIRALAMDPDILLFDEPTSALDPLSKKEIVSIIQELANEGKTIIFATHEIDLAQNISDKTIFMSNGRIIEYDKSNNLFEKPKNDETKAFIKYKLKG